MSTDKPPSPDQQAKRRTRRRRTREEREKRDAAFAGPTRGRPVGTTLPFFEDDDRFAIAMIYFGEASMRLPQYVAAYIVVALTSKKPIDARSVDNLLSLAGSSDNATVKGRAQGLVAKCERQMTIKERGWISSSAAYLGMFIKLMTDQSPDPMRSKLVVDALGALGWMPTLRKITEKVSAIAGSNLPPSNEAVSRRVKKLAESLRSKSKNQA